MTSQVQASFVGLGFLLLAIGHSFLQGTVMALQLPEIGASLELSHGTVTLAAALMLATSGGTLVAAGRLSDRIGRRRTTLLGILVVMIASVLIATATGGVALLLGRALQGVGTAMLLTAIGLVSLLFREGSRRRLAFGLLSASVGIGLALAPLLASATLAWATWRWAFWLNLPILALAYGGIRVFVAESRNASAETGIDGAGTALLMLAVVALLFALTQGPTYGWWWATPECESTLGWRLWISPVAILGIGSATALFGFVVLERSRASSGQSVLLDPALFRMRGFSIGCAVSFLFVLGGYALQFLIPVLGRVVLGNGHVSVAALTAISGLGIAAGGVLSAPLGARLGARDTLLLGVAMSSLCVIGVVGVTSPSPDPALIAPLLVVFGIGYGLAYALSTDVTLIAVDPDRAGLASGVLVACRTIAMAVGAAGLTTLTAHAASSASEAPAHALGSGRAPLELSAGILGLALLVGLLLPRRAATERQPARQSVPIQLESSAWHSEGPSR